MMSKLTGLMKYRYQKKEDEARLAASAASKTNGTSSRIHTTPVKARNGVTSVPDTPESQQTSFGPKITNDPSRSVLKTPPRATPTKFSSLSPESQLTREQLANLSSLQSMFPSKPRAALVESIRNTENFDGAVDYLIDENKFEEASERSKRERSSSQNSPDSSPGVGPRPAKRVRMLSEEGTPSQSPTVKASGTQDPGSRTLEDLTKKVDFVQEAFPKLERPKLFEVLKKQKFEVEATIRYLSTAADNPVSETQNVGSIKAFQLSRVISSSNKAPDSDDEAPMTISISNKVSFPPIKSPAKDGENVTVLISNKVGPASRRRGDDDDDVGSEDWDAAAAAEDSSSDEEASEYLTADEQLQKSILRFANESTVTELASMSGCSKKKATAIMELRPISTFSELLLGCQGSKVLSTFPLVAACKELLKVRGVVERLMKRCDQISDELEGVANQLSSTTEIRNEAEAVSKGYLLSQPSILNDKMQLKPYQIIGLNWLRVMHEQEVDGILGDEMGLGKTIQTIAFLAHLLETGHEGPHIIIAPSSCLDNWLRELQIWCPKLKVMLYYGQQAERSSIRQQILDGTYSKFHVALTTYNMATGSTEDRMMMKRFKFHYAIFDEGHMLKNMSSMRYKSLMKIRAHRRMLLTGTPLQNNLIELMSLLAFVMPDIFMGKTEQLKRIFTSISGKNADDERSPFELETITHAKNILKPFFLRRLKTEVLKQLPKKTEHIQHISLVLEQQKVYENLRQEITTSLADINNESIKRKGSAMIMQLRKAANHPLLHRNHYDDATLHSMAKIIIKEPTHRNAVEKFVYEDMEVMHDFELHQLCNQYHCLKRFRMEEDQITNSGKFKYLDELLPDLKEKGSRVLLFSQFTMMLDIIEVYMNSRGHEFLRLDGQTSVAERQGLIDQFNTDDSLFVFLLSTKAGGLGINLTAANVVVMHDLDFNPYNDKQAEDRCHRVGQTRDVTIYRLVSSNTVEEAIHRCAQGKLKLEKDITSSNSSTEISSNDVGSLLKEALAMEKLGGDL